MGEKHHSDSNHVNGGDVDVTDEGDSGATGAMHAIGEERLSGTTPFAAAAAQQDAARRSGSGVPLLRVSSAPSRESYR